MVAGQTSDEPVARGRCPQEWTRSSGSRSHAHGSALSAQRRVRTREDAREKRVGAQKFLIATCNMAQYAALMRAGPPRLLTDSPARGRA